MHTQLLIHSQTLFTQKHTHVFVIAAFKLFQQMSDREYKKES